MDARRARIDGRISGRNYDESMDLQGGTIVDGGIRSTNCVSGDKVAIFRDQQIQLKTKGVPPCNSWLLVSVSYFSLASPNIDPPESHFVRLLPSELFLRVCRRQKGDPNHEK